MTAVLVLAAVAAGCVQAAAVLATATWPRRSPAAAIVLWQAIGLSWGLATVGTLIGLGAARQRSGIAGGALRARQRQRDLLGLLAHGDPKVPGALVVDYPAAAAYCLPGLRSAIVISA